MLPERGARMLHITNGESTQGSLQQSGIPGDVLAWKDVLHEGPVPANLSLAQMSQVRARFIADSYKLPYDEVVQSFTQRDRTLARFRNFEEVVFWFEHDLYDQLQLIQILDWFAEQKPGSTRLSLICINTFPGIDHFMGLGQLTPAQLASLFDTRQSVTRSIFDLSSRAWNAFCSPTPTAIETLVQSDTTDLPFLAHALTRHLEEFPATDTGLSRSEKQILEVIDSGIQHPGEIFRASLKKEDAAFMGDLTFFKRVTNLCENPHPLLQRVDSSAFSLPMDGMYDKAFRDQALVLTSDGQAALLGRVDWIALRGGIDQWLGGTHLQGRRGLWRWDVEQRRLRLIEE
ncbi:MAG TPA: DUF1835 domain-containing protein [Ktedonobacteraceae bacterium]|nr:DUF1835 domain-containing protein [Ktedonobacteraceae bacterium]